MAEADPFENTRMTLGEHLEELRSRLVRSAIVLVVAMAVAWGFRSPIAGAMMGPYHRATSRINANLAETYGEAVDTGERDWREVFTSPDPETRQLLHPVETRPLSTQVGESFFFALNVCLGFALLVGSPFFLWQMWQFIAAGLYPHEKKGVRFAFPVSAILFLVGAVFAFFTVVPTGMYFLNITLDPEQVATAVKLDSYFRFLRTLCLGMGVIFQLPVLMVYAMRFGLIEPKTFGRYRGHWVVGSLVIAAFLTPGPDFYSQLMMAIPMVILYEIGIQIGKLVSRPRTSPDTDLDAGASA